MKNHFYNIRWPPLNVAIFISHCVMGSTPMTIVIAHAFLSGYPNTVVKHDQIQEYYIAIRSLYRHMVCNVSVSCKANGDRNQLERG